MEFVYFLIECNKELIRNVRRNGWSTGKPLTFLSLCVKLLATDVLFFQMTLFTVRGSCTNPPGPGKTTRLTSIRR